MYNGKLTIAAFTEMSIIKHNGKYDYSLVSFNSSRDKIDILCPLHGIFNQRVSHHKSGQGCPTCKKRNTLNNFIVSATKKHNNLYDYSKSTYNTNRTPIEIICSIHGTFKQTPSNHLKGHGCKSCNYIGRYSKTNFSLRTDLQKVNGTLYVVKLFNADEIFYKIGITKNSIFSRFDKIKMYDVEKIHTIKGNLYELFKLEQHVLKQIVYKNRYTPKIRFGGDCECFDFNQLSSVLSSISEIPKDL